MENRIEAPAPVAARVRQVQQMIQQLQAEANAMLYGAAVALNVPEGWSWDGIGGWVAQKPERKPKP